MPITPPAAEFPYGKPTAEPMYLVDNYGNPLAGNTTTIAGTVTSNPYTATWILLL